MGRLKKNAETTPPWEGDVDTKIEAEVKRPEIWDAGWQDFILNQFTDADKDKDGHPRSFALHNAILKNLGTIVHNVSETVEGATQNNEFRATANHVLHIQWNNDKNDIRVFGDTADVYVGTAEPAFARHAAAMAGTRARSRTYRLALNLTVISAEEATSVPVTESGIEKYITKGQLDAIDTMCRKLDMNASSYLNSGKAIYRHPSHVRWDDAQIMIEKLGKFQRNRETIPDNLSGYESGWLKDAKN